ncbi:HAD hydrolase-like protein [Achromobacter sp. SIMBA_011]|uniref:N-acetylmuramic acid 6-phosphate phosphatase n=1 Tax=Achromobacter dolens TaxID=1287738 RepID=A0A6S7CGT6_9BURK|nr:HAD hydrolase-like protein [Achromobacter dolens]MBQ2646835.1 HAD hydrolase-like protein [Achromobacter sp.]OAS95944.1 HAD family hydrolase [Achromobacter xylosoxidans]MCZ8407505.1 HAD hydrolase-like protein [Achromobacter dolens]CAB3633946.1 N-acetylmuramic acid 6-phosphate phosphatase [Achromobacter dolens]CAB3836649.1 N-acetylmuramic acid 6-phosphate phosphatase [Achromobacter dolens]
MKYDIAAFDFDGTLADTMPWFNSILNTVADKYGFRKIDAAERDQLRHRDAGEILKFLGIPLWKLPAIMAHVRTLMQEIDPSVRLFDGVPDALARLKAGGLRLAVVSSNSLENVQRVLGPETAALFDDYECGTDLFGKAAKIERLLQRHDTPPERFLLVGDEMRDIDAARKAGVRVGSVAWGYNHVDALRDRGPDELFMQVAELPAALA